MCINLPVLRIWTTRGRLQMWYLHLSMCFSYLSRRLNCLGQPSAPQRHTFGRGGGARCLRWCISSRRLVCPRHPQPSWSQTRTLFTLLFVTISSHENLKKPIEDLMVGLMCFCLWWRYLLDMLLNETSQWLHLYWWPECTSWWARNFSSLQYLRPHFGNGHRNGFTECTSCKMIST